LFANAGAATDGLGRSADVVVTEHAADERCCNRVGRAKVVGMAVWDIDEGEAVGGWTSGEVGVLRAERSDSVRENCGCPNRPWVCPIRVCIVAV
jgi:hypothetical protein